MSALNEADFGSDTDDDDYVPAGEVHEASEEDNSGEDENPVEDNGSKPKKKRKNKKIVSGRKNIFDTDEEKVDWKKELEEERKEMNEEKEKQKADDLFAAFKKDTSSKSGVPKKVSSISSLFDSAKPDLKVQETQKPSSRLASLFDDIPKQTESSDVIGSSNGTKSKPKSLLSGLFDDQPKQDSKNETLENINSDGSSETKSDKIEITKVFDFAGETVTVSKEVSADSSEAKKFLKSQQDSEESRPSEVATGGVKRSGLAGIVGSIGKKQKMGVLDKSKLDWNSFVTQEGISEELKTHNKGKEG